MSLDQESLDRASWELQRHFGREGSIYGIKACEEIARIAIVAYGAQSAVPEGGLTVPRETLEQLRHLLLVQAWVKAERIVNGLLMNSGGT